MKTFDQLKVFLKKKSNYLIISSILLGFCYPYKADAATVTSVVLTGPTKILKGNTAQYEFTVMGTAKIAGHGEDLYWTVIDQDDPVDFDDELKTEKIFSVTGDPLNGNKFTFTETFGLICSSDCEVSGADGNSGEGEAGDPAEVFVLIEDDDGSNLMSSNILLVECVDKLVRLDRSYHWSGDSSGESILAFNDNTLSFSDMSVTPTLKLSDGSMSINDPLEGATILINNTSLAGVDPDQGWFFEDTSFQYVVDGTPVLTADIVDSFLFTGGGNKPEFDSEFQGRLSNININNTIGSAYLDDLQAFTDNGGNSHVSFYSDLLSTTNNLTLSGSSMGDVSADGTKQVPENSSIFGLLFMGTVGVGSKLLRKQKQEKFV